MGRARDDVELTVASFRFRVDFSAAFAEPLLNVLPRISSFDFILGICFFPTCILSTIRFVNSSRNLSDSSSPRARSSKGSNYNAWQ